MKGNGGKFQGYVENYRNAHPNMVIVKRCKLQTTKMSPMAKINQPSEPVIVIMCKKVRYHKYFCKKTAHQPDSSTYQDCCAVIVAGEGFEPTTSGL